MAEELKKETETKEVTEAYSYRVVKLSNGLYDFEWLGEHDDKELDKYHMALDIIELGKRLDRQILIEEATRGAGEFVMGQLRSMAEQQPTEPESTEAAN